MHWHGQTLEDHDKQITGFSTTAGDAGYLREAYHGGPYVTRYLVQESFDESWYDNATEEERENYKGKPIPAAVLRERLPRAVIMAAYRHATVYGGGEDEMPWVLNEPAADTLAAQSFPGKQLTDEEVKAETEKMMASPQVQQKLRDVFAGIEIMRGGGDELVFAANIPPALLTMVEERIRTRALADYMLSFVDFVRLAELKEQETGQPVTVYASYWKRGKPEAGVGSPRWSKPQPSRGVLSCGNRGETGMCVHVQDDFEVQLARHKLTKGMLDEWLKLQVEDEQYRHQLSFFQKFGLWLGLDRNVSVGVMATANRSFVTTVGAFIADPNTHRFGAARDRLLRPRSANAARALDLLPA